MKQEFHLLGQCIHISDEQDRYYQLYDYFRTLAVNANRSFRMFYENSTDSLDSLLDKAPNYVLQLYDNACIDVLQSLVKYDLYEYNQEYLVDNYIIPNSNFKKAYDELDEFNASLIADQEAQNAYRTARRQSRGRWVGGGFGVKNAIQGAATAGMMNLATGTVHGIFNLAGSALTSLSVSSKKNKVYTNPETVTKLCQAVFLDIFNLHLAFADLVSKHTDVKFAVITPEDKKKSNILFKNIQQLNIPIDKKKELLVEALQLNPYNADLYLYLYKNFPSDIDSIQPFIECTKAEHALFLISRELTSYYSTLPVDTEEDALMSKTKLEKQMQLWHISSSKELRDINRRLAAFDASARTFDGVEYETREECAKARKDLSELQDQIKSLGSITPHSLKKWNDFKEHVCSGNYSEQVKSIIIPQIDEKYQFRLTEIRHLLRTGNPSNNDLSSFINEITDMNIDCELKEPHLCAVHSKIEEKKRNDREILELNLFKKEFYACNPCLPESKRHLRDVIHTSCPSISEDLDRLLNAFTPENVELIKNFDEPKQNKRPSFHGTSLLAALISLFISIFVFRGLLRIVFFCSAIYCFFHIFSLEYHISKKDQMLEDLKYTMTYYGKLIHPMLKRK